MCLQPTTRAVWTLNLKQIFTSSSFTVCWFGCFFSPSVVLFLLQFLYSSPCSETQWNKLLLRAHFIFYTLSVKLASPSVSDLYTFVLLAAGFQTYWTWILEQHLHVSPSVPLHFKALQIKKLYVEFGENSFCAFSVQHASVVFRLCSFRWRDWNRPRGFSSCAASVRCL